MHKTIAVGVGQKSNNRKVWSRRLTWCLVSTFKGRKVRGVSTVCGFEGAWFCLCLCVFNVVLSTRGVVPCPGSGNPHNLQWSRNSQMSRTSVWYEWWVRGDTANRCSNGQSERKARIDGTSIRCQRTVSQESYGWRDRNSCCCYCG